MSSISPPSSQSEIDQNYPDWAKKPESREVRVVRIAAGVLALLCLFAAGGLVITHVVTVGMPGLVSGPAAAPFIILVAGGILGGTYFGILAYRENKKLAYQKEKKDELDAIEKQEKEKAKVKPKSLKHRPIYDEEGEQEWREALENVPLKTRKINFETDEDERDPQNQVPMIGQYGNNYRMTFPYPAVRLPNAHLKQFPRSLQKAVKGKDVAVYFAIHRNPGFNSSVVNLVNHKMIFPNGKNGDKKVAMGIFPWKEDGGGIGISEASGPDAIAFGTLKKQRVCVHPSGNRQAYSPNNARFNMDKSAPVALFASAVVHGDKAVVTLNLMLNENKGKKARALQRVKDSIQGDSTIFDVWEAIKESGLGEKIVSRVGRVLGISPTLDGDEEN